MGEATILVVDDNRLSRLTLVRAVEELGYVALAAEGGEQALDVLASEGVDAVLLDIVMPGMDGYQVLEHLRNDTSLREIPVIIISAVDESESIARGIELGALDHLPKPYDSAILRARLLAGVERKRLRDLERAYLEQEAALRENEKLAALGRLTAGLAHEMNNPAAAARRGADQIKETTQRLWSSLDHLLRPVVGEEAHLLMAKVLRSSGAELDPIARSESEEAIELWLAGIGIEAPWELAAACVDAGVDVDDLDALTRDMKPQQRASAIELVVSLRSLVEVGAILTDATTRLSELVGSLKVYTHMDEAPVNNVDVHEELDSTLVMLRHRLGGATVQRDYDHDLPRITAHGSELNQVWTNLIDNAVDAIGDTGTVTLRTGVDDGWVVIEVEDDGAGIPEDVLGRIFDPFVTSKPPGSGTGLGLSIAHRIVTERHRGRIEVESRPGRTCLRVLLPIESNS